MKPSHNTSDPEADLRFIVEELFDMFNSAELNGEGVIELVSCVGSRFHSRVKNAAEHLGIAVSEAR